MTYIPLSHKFLTILFGVFCILVTGCALFTLVLAGVYAASVALFGSFVVAAAGIGLIVLYKRNNKVHDIICSIPWHRVYLVSQIIALVAMLIVGFVWQGNTGTDYKDLADIAYAVVNGQENPHVDKYGAHPHLHFMLMFMIFLFRGVHMIVPDAPLDAYILVHTFFNILGIHAAIICCVIAMRIVAGRKRASALGLSLLVLPPLWLNCTNPYSDTGAFFFVGLALLFLALFLRASKHSRKRYLFLGLFAVAVVLGYEIKATVAIMLVAFLILIWLKEPLKGAAYASSVVLVTALICVGACSGFVDVARPDSLPYGAAEKDRWALPYAHWISMSYNPGREGGYVEKDFQDTMRRTSYAQKQAFCEKRLKKRLKALGIRGIAWRIAVQKPSNLMRSGAFVKNEQPANWVKAESRSGQLFSIFYNVAEGYHYLMLLGVAACGIMLFLKRASLISELLKLRFLRFYNKGKHARIPRGLALYFEEKRANHFFFLLFCMLVVFGFMFFICVFWEAKARYPIQFLSLFYIMAIEGLWFILLYKKPLRSHKGRAKQMG